MNTIIILFYFSWISNKVDKLNGWKNKINSDGASSMNVHNHYSSSFINEKNIYHEHFSFEPPRRYNERNLLTK